MNVIWHEYSPSFAFPRKFRGLHVRKFQNKIPCLLHASYMNGFDSLRLNKWCNIRLSEGYFVAKYKKIVRGIAYYVGFANIFAFFTSIHTHVCYTSLQNKLRIAKAI